MSDRRERIARAIRSFVEDPITNLVKGIALLLIGLSDASHTLRDDITHGHVRVGHGLVIIGLFSILGALPHLLDSLEAGERYLEQASDVVKKFLGSRHGYYLATLNSLGVARERLNRPGRSRSTLPRGDRHRSDD